MPTDILYSSKHGTTGCDYHRKILKKYCISSNHYTYVLLCFKSNTQKKVQVYILPLKLLPQFKG